MAGGHQGSRRSRIFGAGLPAGRTEVRLAYAGLSDLFEDTLDDLLPHLPVPQRGALEIAVLRSDSGGRTLDDRAVFAGVLSAIRWLSRRGHLAIAIDDAQWLDPPSGQALAFAIRRLRSEPVAVVASVRADRASILPLDIDAAFGDGRLTRLDVGPMSYGALHEPVWRADRSVVHQGDDVGASPTPPAATRSMPSSLLGDRPLRHGRDR